MSAAKLDLTRSQILAYRRRVGALDERMPWARRSLRRAAWAGLQDSAPRAALLSLHARVADTGLAAWRDPFFVQLWGPRFHVYVVAARDHAVFTLGRLPDRVDRMRLAGDLAARLDTYLDGGEMPFGVAGRALGEKPNQLRYAAAAGRVLLRWDGANQPVVRTVSPPDVDPHRAQLELARRYVHVFGPTTAEAFTEWAGISKRQGGTAFTALGKSLTAVRTPIGDGRILADDEPLFRSEPEQAAPARLLPSGDAYFLRQGADRELLVPDGDNRRDLWPSRVWPGAVLVGGDIVGTWRRTGATATIHTWRRLSRTEHEAVAAEAESLPLPGPITVRWED